MVDAEWAILYDKLNKNSLKRCILCWLCCDLFEEQQIGRER